MKYNLTFATMLILFAGCVETVRQSDNGPIESTAVAPRTTVGVASNGERIANELCGTCHQTPVRAPEADIGPPWSAIAKNPDMTNQNIREFLAIPHWPIRRNILSPQQIEDVVAYIRTLEST